MSDTPAPPPGATPFPPGFPTASQKAEASRAGCLKWGLVGCAALSVVLIVGLVFLGTRARSLMDWAMGKLSDQVLALATSEVSSADREAFRAAYSDFTEKAKTGKVEPQKIRELQSKVTAAVGDGRVTPEELRDLTAFVRDAAR